ncbi:MAG: apolipoprotein N-acyltransferase, partial [Polyangiaceae bacterium]
GLCVALHRRLHTAFEISFALAVLVTLCMPNVFVWSPAGLLSPWPLIVQSADLIGERGVSAVLAFHMALASAINRNVLRDLRAKRGARRLVLCVLLLPLPFVLYGFSTMSRYANDDGPQARIGLVQAAIHPQYRWKAKNWPRILDTLRQQTRIAEAAGVDLTVWPEAAYPYPLRHDATRAPRDERRRLLDDQLRGPLLFGLISMAPPTREPDGRYRRDRYNSATILSSDGTLQPSYDKMELLWFGETVPGGRYLPWLRRMFQRSGGLIPGAELRALRTATAGGVELRIGVLNCYEDTLPDLGRRIAQDLDPNLLVNVTNDAWFIGTAEPELHLRLSVMRAIELRRDLVRSVNLGVSAWVDAGGRIRAQQATSEPSALIVTPRLRNTPATLYARFGDLPLLLLLAAAACTPWLRRMFGANDNADGPASAGEQDGSMGRHSAALRDSDRC